ncbi:MAG: (2Fe-2S)-binding protein [Acidobacteria bacterium]|nr:(2Fe-2S)-binding protein [Acidobacteriota bacterium]
MSKSDERLPETPEVKIDPAVSRRNFLKGSGLALSLPLIAADTAEAESAEPAVPIFGPEKTAITLTINGKPRAATVEPRVTLLDCLRNDLDTTGAKRVCDRGTCGACTVQMDGKAVYACSVLAIEAQGHKITTVESLANGDTLHPVQKAFWDNDAQQCGFCTPGFVMACKSLLDKHPTPTDEQIKLGVGGNLCRCGTYVGIKAAIAQASAAMKKGGRA